MFALQPSEMKHLVTGFSSYLSRSSQVNLRLSKRVDAPQTTPSIGDLPMQVSPGVGSEESEFSTRSIRFCSDFLTASLATPGRRILADERFTAGRLSQSPFSRLFLLTVVPRSLLFIHNRQWHRPGPLLCTRLAETRASEGDEGRGGKRRWREKPERIRSAAMPL